MARSKLPDIPPWVALALLALLVVGALFLLFPQPRPVGIATIEREVQAGFVEVQKVAKICPVEGRDYDHTCSLNVLFWKRCEAGQESERKFDCTKLSKGGLEGYCNPSLPVPGTPDTRAACDLGPRETLRASPTATVAPTPTPTEEARIVRVGPSFCGDGRCNPSEDCVSCPADCACPLDSSCNPRLRICVQDT